VHINWWTLALQTINVLVLIWLLSRFLYRPVAAAIAARQVAADKLLADAEAAKKQAVAEEAALRAGNEALAAECELIRAEVRASAEADRVKLFDVARQDAARRGEDAKADIAADRISMQKELEAQAAKLAADMTGKLVARLPPDVVQEAMTRSLVGSVGAMSQAERTSLVAGGPLTIVTRVPVEQVGRAQFSAALAKVLGAPSEVTFKEDQALIGGCELHGPHVHIRNSWRADLDAMLGHLAVDGGDDRA
jgi:F-type H+-transporting ATPase subunit b